MEGLAEWKLADGRRIQVFQDKDRAGSSSVTFLVSGLDDQFAELKAKGISIERTTTSDYVKTATVTDPAGTGRRDFRLRQKTVCPANGRGTMCRS